MLLQLFPTDVLEANFIFSIVLVGVMVQNKTILTFNQNKISVVHYW